MLCRMMAIRRGGPMGSASPIDSLVLGMAVDRFAVYSSLALIFGVGAFTTVLAPARVACEIARRLRPFVDVAVTVFLVGTLLWLPLEAGQINGAWDGAFQPDTLQTLLSATTSGTLWLERTAVCLLLVAVRFALPGRPGRQMVFLLSAGSLVSLVFVGHAAMDDGWLGDLHEANDAVHILAASGWIGCLIALVPCMDMLDDPDLRRQACASLIRFSTVGHVAVALVLLTGVVNTYLVLGRWPFHLASLYQVLLLGKVALAFGMVALALMNRYAVVPRLRARGAAAIADLRRLTIAELGLAAGVLALVSLFGLLDPL
jgi:putative copper resistance protein D